MPKTYIELWPDVSHNQRPRLYVITTSDPPVGEPTQTASEPDDFYYQAQGQEPPPAKKYKQWFIKNFEVSIMLFFIALILVGLVFWPVGY